MSKALLISGTIDFGPGPGAQPHRLRPATAAERRFLRRYNLIRLLRMFWFWLTFLMVLGALAAVHGFVLMLYSMADPGQTVPLLVAGAAMLLLMVLDGFLLSRWGASLGRALRMRPVLRVPQDLQVLEFDRAPLASEDYRSDEFNTLFSLGDDSVDIPNHWLAELLRRERESGGDPYPQIAIVRLQGAQNRVLPIQLQYGAKPLGFDRRLPNLVLSDLGDIVVGLNDLSIDREMRARLPLIRANSLVGALALVTGLAALCLGLLWEVTAGMDADRRTQMEMREAQLAYDVGPVDQLDLAALQDRGAAGLAVPPEYGGGIVTASHLDYVEIAGPGGQVDYIAPDDLAAMRRAIRVFPDLLPGRNPLKPADIADYRQKILDHVGAGVGAAATPAYRRVAALIGQMPDALIERQLRSQADFSQPSQAFVQALMPQPAMGRMQDRYPAPRRGLRNCLGDDARCDPISTASRWQNPAFRRVGDRIEVFSGSHLTELAALRAELGAPPPERIAARLFWGAVVAGAMTVLLVVSHVAARWRIRRYHRQWGSARAA